MSEAMYDSESEKAGQRHDRIEREYESMMRNLVIGDIRDNLDRMMDKEEILINLFQAYFTKNPKVMFNNFDQSMRELMWELAEREVDRG